MSALQPSASVIPPSVTISLAVVHRGVRKPKCSQCSDIRHSAGIFIKLKLSGFCVAVQGNFIALAGKKEWQGLPRSLAIFLHRAYTQPSFTRRRLPSSGATPVASPSHQPTRAGLSKMTNMPACRSFCSHACLDGLEKLASAYSGGRLQNTFSRRWAGGNSRNGERPPCGPSSRPTMGQGTPILLSSMAPSFPSPSTTATGKRTSAVYVRVYAGGHRHG